MDQSPLENQNPYASPPIPIEDRQSIISTTPNKPNEPLVQPIRIFGEISKADYDLGLKLGASKGLPGLKMGIFIGMSVWIATTAIILRNFDLICQMIISTNAIIIVAIFILRWMLNRSLRAAIFSKKGPFEYDESAITEEGLKTQSTSIVTKHRWSAFRKYRVNDRVAVIHIDGFPRIFYIIPRSKFQNPEDWECFIGLLERKMPRC